MATIEEKFLQLLNKSGTQVKPHTWKNKDGTPNLVNQRIFVQYLGEKLGYRKMEDWYKITTKLIRDNRGSGLLAGFYSDSVSKFVMAMFPNYNWVEWKFGHARYIWKDKRYHKKYAIWLREQLGYNTMEDWYKITQKIINKNYGRGLLLHQYDGSPSKFVIAVFPDYNWVEWKFGHARYIWQDKKYHKKYAKWLGEQLGYKTMEDWYKLTSDHMRDNYGGGGLLRYYNSSPSKFVMAMFPDYNWLGWKFGMSARRLWKNKDNRKKYAIWLGKQLGYKTMEDWYKLIIAHMRDNYGGGGLLRYYNSSPSKFVMDMFPDYEWVEWKFGMCPQGFWKDKGNRKKYAIWLGKQLGYNTIEDWYKISRLLIKENYGGGMLAVSYGDTASKFVMDVFPEYNWDISKFKKNYSRGQIQYMEFLKISTPDIRHILNHPEGEFYIPGSREFTGSSNGYHADGFSEIKLMIYEYLGDKCHGNPAIYKSDDWINWVKATAGELYNNELKRRKFCEDSGFGYHSIWESEWRRGIKAIRKLQRKFKEYL